MFTIEFDRQHRLLLASCTGVFGTDDIGTLDAAGAVLFAAEGPFHVLIDFSAVESVRMPDAAIAERGKRRQMCPGYERIVVAPQPEIFELYRLFAANQQRVGTAAPKIVRSMDKALLHLGIGKPQFRPLATS